MSQFKTQTRKWSGQQWNQSKQPVLSEFKNIEEGSGTYCLMLGWKNNSNTISIHKKERYLDQHLQKDSHLQKLYFLLHAWKHQQLCTQLHHRICKEKNVNGGHMSAWNKCKCLIGFATQTIHGGIWHCKNCRFGRIGFSHGLKHLIYAPTIQIRNSATYKYACLQWNVSLNSNRGCYLNNTRYIHTLIIELIG